MSVYLFNFSESKSIPYFKLHLGFALIVLNKLGPQYPNPITAKFILLSIITSQI